MIKRLQQLRNSLIFANMPNAEKIAADAIDEIERLRRNLAGAYRDQGCTDDEISEYLEMDLYPDEPVSTRQKP